MQKKQMFLSFLESMKIHDEALVECIKEGFKIYMESYEDWGQPEYDDYTAPNFDPHGDSTGSYKYNEPLDIFVDNSKGYSEFSVYSDDGDLHHKTTDINDAFNFIKKTNNKLGIKPIKSYGNRWINHGDEYTIEDLVYVMDNNDGRKPRGLLNAPEEQIQQARENIKSKLTRTKAV